MSDEPAGSGPRKSGLDDFGSFGKQVRGLLNWPSATLLATPIIAQLASISPVWPPQIGFLTSVLELVGLILIYQFMNGARKATVDRVLIAATLVLLLSSILYLKLTSAYGFTLDDQRYVRGFACTPEAARVYGDCPFLTDVEIDEYAQHPQAQWTTQSIAEVEATLIALWSIAFLALTAVVGSFVAFQRRPAEDPISTS
jgi:hypothetical protein